MGIREIYEGLCISGPMNGQQGQSRHPAGFVLVDVQGKRAWIYDAALDNNSEQIFVGREELRLDPDKAWAASQSTDWDVRAYDDGKEPEEVGL